MDFLLLFWEKFSIIKSTKEKGKERKTLRVIFQQSKWVLRKRRRKKAKRKIMSVPTWSLLNLAISMK